MNALFFTQSGTLKLYHDVLSAMREDQPFDKVGFYVSDSGYYRKFMQEHPDFEAGEVTVLKEWVVTRQAQKHPLDIDKLREYEEKLGVSGFWDALVCDRRIVNGPNFSFRQDYKPQFSHEFLLTLLLENLIRIEKLFDEIQPDFTSCFICTRLGEYLCYLFSRARGIPFLNLRPTRMDNYMVYGGSVYEPSELVAESYRQYRRKAKKDVWQEKAKELVGFSREHHARYEGVFLPTQAPPQVGNPLKILRRFSSSLTSRLREIASEEIAYRRGPKLDRAAPGALVPLLYRNFLNPLLVRRVKAYLADKYVPVHELPETDYAFFPLHKEPEVTLLVYSKAFRNQIEVVRNVACSLPVGMVLLLKEHPASVGTRPLNYYRKLSEIPNVRFVDSRVEPRQLIQHAKLVVNIAGSVGFEALLLRKPVLIFGKTPYEMLPPSMVRRVTDLSALSETITALLRGHKHDEQALLDYIAATMKESVPIEFYTKLLGRAGQFATAAESDRQEHVQRLADYTLKMVARMRKRSSRQAPAAVVRVLEEPAVGNGCNGKNGHNPRKAALSEE